MCVCARTLRNELPARYDDKRGHEEVVQDDATHLQRLHPLPAPTACESNECWDSKRERGEQADVWSTTVSQDPHNPTLNFLLAAQVSHLQKIKKMERKNEEKREEKA